MTNQTLLFPVSLKKKLAYIDRDGNIVHKTDQKSDLHVANYNGGYVRELVLNPEAQQQKQKLRLIKKIAGRESIRGAEYIINHLGFADHNGNEVIECKYINAYEFVEGVALVQVPEAGHELHQWFNSKPNWILINENGEQISDNRWEWAFQFSEGIAAVQINGKLGYINTRGELIIPADFDFASRFIDGSARVAYNTPVINESADVSPKFIQMTPTRPGKFGLIDKTGNFLIKPIFGSPPHFTSEYNEFHSGLARFEHNGLYGFINKLGDVVIPPAYNNVGFFREDLVNVCMGKKWGYLDTKDKVQVPFAFAWCGQFSEGRAPVQLSIAIVDDKTGKKQKKLRMGFIDKAGSVVIPAQFTDASSFYDGLAMVNFGQKMGYIDYSGKILYKEP